MRQCLSAVVMLWLGTGCLNYIQLPENDGGQTRDAGREEDGGLPADAGSEDGGAVLAGACLHITAIDRMSIWTYDHQHQVCVRMLLSPGLSAYNVTMPNQWGLDRAALSQDPNCGNDLWVTQGVDAVAATGSIAWRQNDGGNLYPPDSVDVDVELSFTPDASWIPSSLRVAQQAIEILSDCQQVCTVGQDQTCNEDLSLSALAGRCQLNGQCQCTPGFVRSPTTGKCRIDGICLERGIGWTYADGGALPSDTGQCGANSCPAGCQCLNVGGQPNCDCTVKLSAPDAGPWCIQPNCGVIDCGANCTCSGASACSCP